MPNKMKTRSGVKKRFRLTAKGHLKRWKAYTSHQLTGKSPKRKRSLRKSGIVDSTQENKTRGMLVNR